MLRDRHVSPACVRSLGRVTRVVPLLLLAAIVLPLTGCAKNAATGERRLMLLSRAEENALGAQAAPEFTAEFGGATDSATLQAYLTQIGASMAAETEADFPDLDWEFTLLDSSVVNAFALPGGKVFITRGLAERLQDESEIAGVVGHEIGHVTAQHANSRISKQTIFSGGLQTIAAVLAVAPEDNRIASVGSATLPALQVGGSLLLLKYGRDEELEADELGMRYMSRVGYDPSGQQRVMQLLAELAGGEAGFDWFASHPDPAYRVNRISEILAAEYRDVPMEGDGRFASRFQTRFLTPASRLPAPRHPSASASTGEAGDVLAGALAGYGWCGVCASAPVPAAPSAD